MRQKLLSLAFALLLASPAAAQFLGPPQNITVIDSGTACVTAPAACASFTIGQATSVAIDISGTWTGTITFEQTANGSTWRSLWVTNAATGAQATTTTAGGTFTAANGGFIGVRARATAAVTGLAVVTATTGYGVSAHLFSASNITGQVAVANGGTGDSTLTNHGVMLGQGTSNVAVTAAGTSGFPLVSGGGSADPSFALLTVPGGGTGLGTLTNHGVVLGQGTSNLAVTAAGTSGFPLVSGGASADPAFALLGVAGGGTGAATSAAYTHFGNFTSGSAAPGFSATPLYQVGTGTGAGPSPIQFHYKYENVANAGDTVYVTTTVFSLPQNSLSTNGDQLHIQLVLSLGATGSHSKTYKCNIGYTNFNTSTGAFTGGNTIMSHATSATSSAIQADMYITRTASNAGFYWEMANVGGSFQTTTWTALSAPDFTAANNILCAANDASSGAAQVTLQEIRMIYTPAGPF